MTDDDAPSRAGLAAQLMREALLQELQRSPAADPKEPVATMLRQIARKLVEKAAEGDVPSIKEICERIDGKSPPGVAGVSNQAAPRKVVWMNHPLAPPTGRASNSSPSTTGPSGSPAS